MLFTKATILASMAASASAAATACSAMQGFKMTFYGFPDNSPPGAETRYNCGGRNNKAAGDGSYANPLSMATEHGRFAECEIVYSPYLQKYLRNEDSCANCNGDWVDVWLGSTTSNGGSALLSCQNTLTQSMAANRAIIEAPPAGLPVSTAEIFDGTCHASTLTYPTADSTASCAGGSGTVTVPAVSSSVASVVASVPSAAASPAYSAKPRRKHMRVNQKGRRHYGNDN